MVDIIKPKYYRYRPMKLEKLHQLKEKLQQEKDLLSGAEKYFIQE
jgi:hypothetical protein